uniref:Hypotheticial protein n=1 Tax=Schistosoma japonicum TaxID=6182 RepID=C7TZ51_SCHJA|nr:hypotheticial protein [Schistosoma japonicum]CAX82929.1 hypotheticial protein [Schistosoma japonicum]
MHQLSSISGNEHYHSFLDVNACSLERLCPWLLVPAAV